MTGGAVVHPAKSLSMTQEIFATNARDQLAPVNQPASIRLISLDVRSGNGDPKGAATFADSHQNATSVSY
jgi:hypothetical protein